MSKNVLITNSVLPSQYIPQLVDKFPNNISKQLQYTEQGMSCNVTAYQREVITLYTTHEKHSIDMLVHHATMVPINSEGRITGLRSKATDTNKHGSGLICYIFKHIYYPVHHCTVALNTTNMRRWIEHPLSLSINSTEYFTR